MQEVQYGSHSRSNLKLRQDRASVYDWEEISSNQA